MMQNFRRANGNWDNNTPFCAVLTIACVTLLAEEISGVVSIERCETSLIQMPVLLAKWYEKCVVFPNVKEGEIYVGYIG